MGGRIPTSLLAPLRALERRLRERFGSRLREVRLFGSYARGEASEDSDVDVLVLVDGLTQMDVADVATDACMVALDTGVPLSPLPMATEHLDELREAERALARTLDAEGVPL